MRNSIVKGVGTLVGLLTCSALAQAADLPSRSAPPVFAAAPINYNDWSGVYVGTTYGYGFNSYHNSQLTSRSVNASGQTGGALVGYNFQSGHIVYGVEGSIDLNVIRKINPGQVGLTPSETDSLYDIRFRGLLGYEFGNFMPFIAGGAVVNETYQYGTGGLNRIPNYYGQVNRTVGWTVGAGLEYKLNPQALFPNLPSWALGPVILRAEYLYQNLPNSTYAFNGQTFRTKSDGNFFRAALIYRFGDYAPRAYIDQAGDVNWAGGYGGILGGYGSVTAHTRTAGVGATNTDADGGLGGIYAGTNFMFGHYMLGFDASTSFADFTGNGRLPGSADPVSYRNYIQADIRGRAGYAFGSFLPFVAAGVGFGRSEQIDRVTGSERGRVPTDALTVGGGLDYRLSERVSLRVEDLYEFKSNSKIVNLNGCDCVQKRDGNIVRAGLAYHFE
ncbi:outer membrane protein [Lichenihabitans psoromatis]|uniref:outer membrane protein n=1 Tax=Lichenihabitans psoromatis TaxID=2528642 RepID=UPI00103692C9|nr:porin family protein [Lichenihabitans psoromatis]